MCYTGECKYENHEGECMLPWGIADYPDDAHCMQMDRKQDEAALAEAEAAEELAAVGP